MQLEDLDQEARIRLVRFVCSFAWADLEVQDAERAFVHRMLDQLGLDAAEKSEAAQWLRIPPMPEDVDPTDIPLEHREVFLSTLMQLVSADGTIDPAEMETLALFEKLLRGTPDDDDDTDS